MLRIVDRTKELRITVIGSILSFNFSMYFFLDLTMRSMISFDRGVKWQPLTIKKEYCKVCAS